MPIRTIIPRRAASSSPAIRLGSFSFALRFFCFDFAFDLDSGFDFALPAACIARIATRGSASEKANVPPTPATSHVSEKVSGRDLKRGGARLRGGGARFRTAGGGAFFAATFGIAAVAAAAASISSTASTTVTSPLPSRFINVMRSTSESAAMSDDIFFVASRFAAAAAAAARCVFASSVGGAGGALSFFGTGGAALRAAGALRAARGFGAGRFDGSFGGAFLSLTI